MRYSTKRKDMLKKSNTDDHGRTTNSSQAGIWLAVILLIGIVIGLSHISTKLWGGKSEKKEISSLLSLEKDMTVAQFGEVNNIPRPILKKILGLQSKNDLQKPLKSFINDHGRAAGISKEQLRQKVKQALALHAEDSSKNWLKIPLKFGLWLTILIIAFVLLRKGVIDAGLRRILYLSAVIIFGVILGADPSPMGPVKDAIALYGRQGIIYNPRLVALSIFLFTVLLANKFICAWGCQLGALQDLIFRLNRSGTTTIVCDSKDTKGIIRQYKPPFAVTNTIRVIFFCVFTIIALSWATDIIEAIDPFKLYKPAMVTMLGWIFLAGLLLASIFIYRPWCHLFCPFGLAGWVVEQLSIFRIRVNKETCTACGACAKVCPSTVMQSILDEKSIKPDCFSCGTCMNICPTNSITYDRSRNSKKQEIT